MAITLFFRDGITLAALSAILRATDRFDLRMSAVFTPGSILWLEFFRADVLLTRERLSTRIRRHERIEREHGTRSRVLRARFESPGFITVDGSGALEKLIDILHSGDLAKEERRAIIARIQAETDLLKAQAARQKIEALSGVVAVLQSLNLSTDEILRLLGGDRALVNLLGEPTSELTAAQTMGELQKVSVYTADK